MLRNVHRFRKLWHSFLLLSKSNVNVSAILSILLLFCAKTTLDDRDMLTIIFSTLFCKVKVQNWIGQSTWAILSTQFSKETILLTIRRVLFLLNNFLFDENVFRNSFWNLSRKVEPYQLGVRWQGILLHSCKCLLKCLIAAIHCYLTVDISFTECGLTVPPAKFIGTM